MATITDLQQLNYAIGIAHGSVSVEEDALAAAKAAADPALIQEQANVIVADTITALTKLARIPTDENERLQMFADMGEQAFKLLTMATSEKVAFHERALAIAQTSPDVWRIEQIVATADGDVTVATLLVACKEDGTGWDVESQAVIDALADPASHAERVFQAQNPDAMQAAKQLASDGASVERALGADSFLVDGSQVAASAMPALAEQEAAAAQPAPAAPAA